MKNCLNCGAQLEDDAAFCASCGTEQAAPVAEDTPVEAPKKKSKLPLVIVLIVVLLALVGGVVAGFLTDWFGLVSPKEEEKEELTYSTLAAAAKATFKANSLTLESEVSHGGSGEVMAVANEMNVRFLFDRDDMLNSTVLMESGSLKYLLSDGVAYSFAHGEYQKQEETKGVWFAPAVDEMFGEEDINWDALMDAVTDSVFAPNSFSTDALEAACDTCRNDKMKLTVKGSTFTYTGADKAVSVAFTVKNDLLTKLVFKMKQDGSETRLMVSFSNVNETAIPEAEINDFVSLVESFCVPPCDKCGDQDGTYEKGGYNLCYDCNQKYDECGNCGRFAQLTDGKCEECLAAVAMSCMCCQTTENVSSVYESRTWTTYYFCDECNSKMIRCPFCFAYYDKNEKCKCDGGVAYRTCQTCGEVKAVREVNGEDICDDCAGGFDEYPYEIVCDMCHEAEATRGYSGHNLCEDCFSDCDLCIGCGNFDYLNDEDFCPNCAGESEEGA